MTANAEIVLEEHPDSLIVPEAAITYDAQKHARSSTWRTPPRRKTGRRVPVKLGVGNGTKHPGARRAQGRRQGRPSLLIGPA